MTTQVKYIALSGGLNLIDSQVTMPDGMLTECLNFEQVFGKQGYSRINGYERYDGHPEPSDATYSVQEFDTGTVAIAVGAIVTGTGASAEVLAVELTTGSWAGGDQAGRLILGNVTGAWANNDAIQVSGVTRALASLATYQGSISETLNTTYKSLAIENRRADISAPTGSGGILGGGVANSVNYCMRNSADGLTAVLYKATGSGWTAVKSGLYPGGDARMIQANFSGASTSLYLFGCDGKNRSWKYDGTTFTFMAPIYGTQGTSSPSQTIGTGAKSFVITQTSRGWVPGQAIVAWVTADASKRMTGTVTSYTSGTNTLVMDVTSVLGTGSDSNWEIGLADFSDKPFDMIAHRDHMFLAFPYGQLQTSNLGDPMTYTTTASLFGAGSDIKGMASIKGGVLAVYCSLRTFIMNGSDKTTWALDQGGGLTSNSSSIGTVFKTVQDVAQTVLALDIGGITSLQATQAFGSFEMSVFSRLVKPYLDQTRSFIVGSSVIRSKNQYRLYASNGVVLTTTILSPNPQIQPQDVAITRSDYNPALTPIEITSAWYGTINGEEYQFFGTGDGMVMREDVGASFDGAEIPSAARLPFASYKSPSQKKRFRKLVLETDAPQITTIYFRQVFDYGDDTYMPSINSTAQGGGGQWNVDTWDTFQWSLPIQSQAEANIDGVGRNMSVLIYHESSLDDAFNIKGLLVHYSPLGLAR